MDAEEVLKSAKPGDLIEVFRTGYEHWAIYVGEGVVVHISSEATGSPSTQNKSRVLHQKLVEVAGSGKCCINNRLDDKYKPRDSNVILRDANRMVGQELPYSLTSVDCEHFFIGLRYGNPESKQVQSAAIGVVPALVGTIIGTGAAPNSSLNKYMKSDATEVLKSAKPGDLIEIFRTLYQHWAIYIGEGDVVHFGSEDLWKLIFQHKSFVRRQKLVEVVGSNDCCIHNRLDEEYKPRDIAIILRDANQLVGQELPYSLLTWNCEHISTWLRNGKPESGQVWDAAAGGALVVGIIIALGAALLSSLKEKEEKSDTTEKQQQQKV